MTDREVAKLELTAALVEIQRLQDRGARSPAALPGEVADLVFGLQELARNSGNGTILKWICTRAATLLQQQQEELDILRSNEADRNLMEGL